MLPNGLTVYMYCKSCLFVSRWRGRRLVCRECILILPLSVAVFLDDWTVAPVLNSVVARLLSCLMPTFDGKWKEPGKGFFGATLLPSLEL